MGNYCDDIRISTKQSAQTLYIQHGGDPISLGDQAILLAQIYFSFLLLILKLIANIRIARIMRTYTKMAFFCLNNL